MSFFSHLINLCSTMKWLEKEGLGGRGYHSITIWPLAGQYYYIIISSFNSVQCNNTNIIIALPLSVDLDVWWSAWDHPLLSRWSHISSQESQLVPRWGGADTGQEQPPADRGLDGRIQGSLLREEARPEREGLRGHQREGGAEEETRLQVIQVVSGHNIPRVAPA